MPPMQTLLVQSLLPTHTLPLPQLTHVAPPQSTSDSVPFLALSAQVGA